MEMQDFRCVAMRLARFDLYACYDFLGGGPSETAAMAILVSLYGCTICMCTGEAGRFLRGSWEHEYGKQTSLRVTAARLIVTVNFSSGFNGRR